MGAPNPTSNPANVAQALVYTLLDVFDATRDLYNTLRNKERRDYEQSLRSKGYPDSRRIEYVEDDDAAGDDSIVFDKAAVKRQFATGYEDVGPQFAIGDVVTQTGLQSQIISLQSVLVTTFLYGPTSSDPISQQLADVVAASRAAGTASVDILAAQHQRQRALPPSIPRADLLPNGRSAAPAGLPYPVTTIASSGMSTAPGRNQREASRARSVGGTNRSGTEVASRPKPSRTDTESTSFSGMTSQDAPSVPSTSYCLYALDLQRNPSQSLASSIVSTSSPYCPQCKRTLALSPGRSWEIFKDDQGIELCFRIQNRFVVKCHRDGADGGYACVLCTKSKSATMDTVCGDVKALIRHVWMDHGAAEFELEEDMQEVVEEGAEPRRRDSVVSRAESKSKGSRRSVSLGPGRKRGRRYEREVETTEVWSPTGRRAAER